MSAVIDDCDEHQHADRRLFHDAQRPASAADLPQRSEGKYAGWMHLLGLALISVLKVGLVSTIFFQDEPTLFEQPLFWCARKLGQRKETARKAGVVNEELLLLFAKEAPRRCVLDYLLTYIIYLNDPELDGYLFKALWNFLHEPLADGLIALDSVCELGFQMRGFHKAQRRA